MSLAETPAVQTGSPWRSSRWLLADSLVRVVATTAVAVWMARQLGPAEFGVLNFASAMTAIFTVLAALGLEVPAVLWLTRGGNPMRGMATLLALRLGAAMLALALALPLAALLLAGDAVARTVTWVSLISVLAAVPTVVDLGFKSRVEGVAPAKARSLAGLGGAAGRVAVLAAGGGLLALAWVLVAETLLTALLLWRAWARAAPTAPTAPADAPRLRDADPALAAKLLRDCMPYLCINAATMLYMKADLVLVGHLASHLQAGLYALAQKMSEVLYIVPVVLADSIYPRLAQRAGATAAADGQLLFDLVAAAAISLVLAATVLAPGLVTLLFGEHYAGSAELFRWHAWTCLPWALEIARVRWLATTGQSKLAWPSAIIGAAVSLAANAWAVPRYGAAGAVGAALLAFTCMGLLSSWMIPGLAPVARMQWRALWPWGRLLRAWQTAAPR